MAPGPPALLLLSLLSLPSLSPCAAGCPAACRCYSATVECGALRLRVVPPGIPPGTQTLFLQDNSIAHLEPGILAPLAALRRLYLHNNSLRALEPGAFGSQSRLLELALTGNRLHGLRVGVFSGLAQLRILYLAGNQLVQLLDFTFLHLPRLQELHLQENSIELLEDQALAGLSSLALLDLSRNQLGTISREALQPLASLQVLRLTENPWRCDCALHWLGAWIKEGGQRLLSSRDKKIMCAEPPRLALQNLLDVSGSSLICIPPSVHVEPLEVTANLGAAGGKRRRGRQGRARCSLTTTRTGPAPSRNSRSSATSGATRCSSSTAPSRSSPRARPRRPRERRPGSHRGFQCSRRPPTRSTVEGRGGRRALMTQAPRIGRPTGSPRARSSAVSKGWKLRSVRRAVCGVWGLQGWGGPRAPADPRLCKQKPWGANEGWPGRLPTTPLSPSRKDPAQNHLDLQLSGACLWPRKPAGGAWATDWKCPEGLCCWRLPSREGEGAAN
ncbi:leucine-rich repeat-containing protein 24 isoform 2-T2 [Hipposideros larvatus]